MDAGARPPVPTAVPASGACYNRASLRPIDLAVIVAYLAGVTWFGARFRGSQKTLKDYFLGGRTAPWWAIALSIVSAETSTLTIIGTPPLAYRGSYVFLQVVFGYLLARIVISAVFLPQYFQGQLFTAYELMQRRFGARIRKVTAGIFLITRALAEGVRVFAVSIVISIILHTSGVASILVIVCLTLFYTFEGGMTAVIWTDVIQMVMYVLGAGISFFVLLHQIPGGWAHVVDAASAAGKFQVFDFGWSWTYPYTFWAGLIGGCFLTTASHGTDQLVVQRLLSAKNQSQSRLALMSSWIVIFIQFTLFLTIGVMLWVLHNAKPIAGSPDRLYPSFIWESLPTGIAGLSMAAIIAAAMANLSAALNSLASATVVDFYRTDDPFEAPRVALSEDVPDLDRFLGGSSGRDRAGCEPVGIGARIGALHRFGHAWNPAWRFPAGRFYKTNWGECRHRRGGGWRYRDDSGQVRHENSVYLVGADW